MYSYDRRVASVMEDPLGTIVDYANSFKAFLKKTEGRPELFRKLGDILETPEISQEAERAEKRIKDVETLLRIAETADTYLDSLQKEYTELADQLAAKGDAEGVAVEDLYNLPHYAKTRDLAEESRKITFRLRREESIDWSLEDYIVETGLYKELSHKEPNDLDLGLTQTLFGALELVTVEDLKDLVNEMLEETKGT